MSLDMVCMRLCQYNEKTVFVLKFNVKINLPVSMTDLVKTDT